MTDRLTALKELAAQVEAGTLDERNLMDWSSVWGVALLTPEEAYRGSLDAALALHEAVLPGWVVYRAQWWPTARHPAIYELWQTRENREGAWCHSHPDLRVEAMATTPARAWLLAILQALIAMEEQT